MRRADDIEGWKIMEKTLDVKVDLCVLEDIEDGERMLQKGRNKEVPAIVVVDQVVPPNSQAVSGLHKSLMTAADREEIPLFYGRGMSPYIVCGQYAKAGQVIAGCTPQITSVGAAGAYGICVTPNEMAALLSGECLKREEPGICRILLKGKLEGTAEAKDLALEMVKVIGSGGGKGKILKIFGAGAMELSLEERITICDVLQKTEGVPVFEPGIQEQEADLKFDLSSVVPQVVLPDSYETIVPASSLPYVKVKCVFIGGTAGGGLKSLALAAHMLKGRKVAYGVRLVAAPATAEIYVEAASKGYITDIMEAGGLVINQCGNPEVQGRVGKDEVMVSNDVENRKGYAGFDTSKTYISDTRTAVQAALSGEMGLAKVKKEEKTEEHRSLTFEGRCWKFGDDIDTDIIIPTQHLNYETMDEIKSHAFEPLRPELPTLLKEGDLIVAGSNFGCGSSREQAAEVILACGVHCIIAKSFARIFFRNAINNGILLLECKELPDEVKEGDIIRVELDKQQITANGKTYAIPAVPENLYNIIMDGGLVKSIMKKVQNHQL